MTTEELPKCEPQEYISISEGVAKRYKRPDMYNDMVQEALVSIYSEIDRVAEHLTRPRAIQLAKKAVWTYVNIGSLPVTVPNHEYREKVSKGKFKRDDSRSVELYNTIKGYHPSTDDLSDLHGDMEATTDTLVGYALLEVWGVAEDVLEPQEFQLLCSYYKMGETTVDLSKKLKVTKQGVSHMLEGYISKVQKGLKVKTTGL